MVTKDQERAALEKIRKIIEGLGEDSYVGMAFEGCFEVARDNIDNDWGCSMKQRAEIAEKSAAIADQKCEALKQEAAELRKQNEIMKQKVLSQEDMSAISSILSFQSYEIDASINNAAEAIVNYADDPKSNAFQEAVQQHRYDVKRKGCIVALQKRVDDARIAGI